MFQKQDGNQPGLIAKEGLTHFHHQYRWSLDLDWTSHLARAYTSSGDVGLQSPDTWDSGQ
jgi:hypothetical protein